MSFSKAIKKNLGKLDNINLRFDEYYWELETRQKEARDKIAFYGTEAIEDILTVFKADSKETHRQVLIDALAKIADDQAITALKNLRHESGLSEELKKRIESRLNA